MNDVKHMESSGSEKMRLRTDHMTYMDGMEIIPHDIFDRVIAEINSYNPLEYSESDVVRAIKSDRCSIDDFKALLSPAADKYRITARITVCTAASTAITRFIGLGFAITR